jgi:hypothetical protein
MRKSILLCDAEQASPAFLSDKSSINRPINNTMFTCILSSVHPATYRLTPGCHVGSPFTITTFIQIWLWSTEVHVDTIQKLRSYLAESTIHLHYKDHPYNNAAYETNLCLP